MELLAILIKNSHLIHSSSDYEFLATFILLDSDWSVLKFVPILFIFESEPAWWKSKIEGICPLFFTLQQTGV